MPPGLSRAVVWQGRGRSPAGKGPGARPAPALSLLPGPGGSQPGPEGSEPPVWDGSPTGGGRGGERSGRGAWNGLRVVLHHPSADTQPCQCPPGDSQGLAAPPAPQGPRRPAGRAGRLLADQLRFFHLSHRVLVPSAAAIPTCSCCSSTRTAGSSGWAGVPASRSPSRVPGPCLHRVRWLSRRSAAGFGGELGT